MLSGVAGVAGVLWRGLERLFKGAAGVRGFFIPQRNGSHKVAQARSNEVSAVSVWVLP